MRIKDNFILRTVGDQYFIVDNCDGKINMVNVYKLNESAAWLWSKVVGCEFTKDTFVDLLCDRYNVDKEEASKDVDALLNNWSKWGLVE
mgnify:CR=1 FL=1